MLPSEATERGLGSVELPLPGDVVALIRRHPRLMVFGSGALVRAPWFGLPLPGQSQPMAATHTVEIVSSLGELMLPERAWTRPTRALVVGVADAPAGSNGLGAIPQARAEARDVARRFEPSALLLDAEATTGAVRAALASGAEVLHVAAHGSSSQEQPVHESGVWLSGPDPLFDVADIMSLDMSAYGLVVLSACDTGRGRDMDGGVIGLARGFLIAGAPVVIASRKAVGDTSTRRLMAGFYDHLLGDADVPPPREALRRAMMDRHAAQPGDISWADFYVFRR